MPLRGLVGVKSKALSTLYVGSGIFLTRVPEARTDEHGHDQTRIRSDGRARCRSGRAAATDGARLTGRVPACTPSATGAGSAKCGSHRRSGRHRRRRHGARFQTSQGLVVLFGCGHAGVINTARAHSQDRRSSGRQGDHRRPASVWRRRRASPGRRRQLKRFGVQQLVGALHRRRSGVSHPRARWPHATDMYGGRRKATLSTRASIRFASRKGFGFQLSAFSIGYRLSAVRSSNPALAIGGRAQLFLDNGARLHSGGLLNQIW